MLHIDFAMETKSLLGSRIGHARKGYGTAIFLELGDLTPPKPEGRSRPSGEWCIAIEWDWRVELGASVLFGSSNTGPEIVKRISEFEGSTIQSIQTFGDVAELLVTLSTGHRIRSTVMVTGDPEWSIRLTADEWLYVTNGELQKGEGIADSTTEEMQAFEHSLQTSKRWATPTVEPVLGSCSQCASFVPLDGQDHLLDYGVCSAVDSRLDGKVVNRKSGCPQFTAEETL